jgi:2-polyprenyl-3-methyl-5-hydroxy-6-metoxy-1,4-benzoquinol methylase
MTQENWHKGKLLDTSGAYWQACALHAAVKLGIFSVLGSQALSADLIADKIEADHRSTTMLLNALTAMGLLEKTDTRYANSSFSAEYLDTKSPHYLGYIIMHHHHLVDSWSRLDQAVRSGQPVRGRIAVQSDVWRENFLMGMFNLASSIAPDLVTQVDLTGRRHLLDLGGGPGTYAIYYCLHNRDLKATIYDLPTTEPFAIETIKKFELADKITFSAGDYLKDEVQGRFDVVWISHILHAENLQACHQILTKAAKVLEPGGMMMIHDFILSDNQDGPLFPALFSLNMLLGTDGGQAYSERQIAEMLSEVGIKNIERIPVSTPNDSGVLVGKK